MSPTTPGIAGAANRLDLLEAKLEQLQRQIHELQDHVRQLEAVIHYNAAWDNPDR